MNTPSARFCPNPDCPNHEFEHVISKKWFSPHGSYYCQDNPMKRIRRYRCDICGKTFSETYFTRSWHLQRRDIDEMELLFEWCKGTTVVNLAQRFHCSMRAIENRISRMQRMAELNDLVFDVDLLKNGVNSGCPPL